MRRSTLIAVAALSLVALASACATSPTDDVGNAVQDTKAAEPTPEEAGANTTTLPAKTPGTEDSGTAADSATTPDTGSTTSSSGSSGTSGSSGSSGSSGTSGSTSSSSSSSSSSGSSGAVGPACSTSDPLKLIIYQVEVSNQSSPVPCPCAATECCYLGITCVAP